MDREYSLLLIGRNSFKTILLITFLFFLLGFYAPICFEIVDLSKKEAVSILGILWQSYISVLSIGLAISAIILAIIQLANRKISFTDLIFQETFYIPLVYFGIINIAILALMQLVSKEEIAMMSEFAFVRVVIISIYLFVIFLGLTGLVFYRTFRFLNFNILIETYLNDVLKKIRNIKDSPSEGLSNFLSSRFNEIDQEIKNALKDRDNVNLVVFLEAIKTASVTRPDIVYTLLLNLRLTEWILIAIPDRRSRSYSTLITYWRSLRIAAVSDLDHNYRMLYSEVPSIVVTELDEQDLDMFSFDLSLHLKELLIYAYRSNEQPNEIKEAYLKSKNYVQDFITLMKKLAERQHVSSLEKAINQYRQIIDFLTNRKRDFEYENRDGQIPTEAELAEQEGRVMLLKVIYQGIFSLASWYAYSHYFYNNHNHFKRKIFDSLMRPFQFMVPSPLTDMIETTPDDIANWRDWIWRLEERTDGTSYSLPNEEQIKAFGAVLFFIYQENLKPKNSNFWLEELLNSFDPQSYVGNMMFNDIPADVVAARVQTLKQVIEQLKAEQHVNELQVIQAAPIENSKINRFKEDISKQWKNSRNLFRVFKEFGAITVNPEEQLKQVGTANMLLRDGKRLFVEDGSTEEFRSDWGKEVNRSIENVFWYSVFSQIQNFKNASNIVAAFEEVMESLKDTKSTAVAFVPSNSMHEWHIDLINSGNYQPFNRTDSKFSFKYDGIYKEKIVVVMFHSRRADKKVIIASLPQGITYQQRVNNNWIDKQLEVTIEEISNENAAMIIAQQPDKYQDQEQAVLLLTTSMRINIQEVMDFKILSLDSVYPYVIG